MTRFGFDLAAWFTDNADQVRRDLQAGQYALNAVIRLAQ
jgi:hypothetical protein